MKRIVYLIRHGEPDFPEGKRLCLGAKTDLSLSKTGEEQASVLSYCFDGLPFEKIYCSKLKRSKETAAILSAGRWPLEVIFGIEEMNCGEWDGLTFDEIRDNYPDIYEVRKTDKSYPPPGGETFEATARRAMEAINKIMQTTQGDIIMIAHSAVNRLVLCRILGIPIKDCFRLDQPYGCINVLTYEEGNWRGNAIGILPNASPDPDTCYQLWKEYQTPLEVQQHCIAVRDQALRMAYSMSSQGVMVHIDILEAAALLHDLCRAEKEHEKKAAEVLREHGWLRLASIVARHHDRVPEDGFDEGDILYLADKYIQGTTCVSLKQRFEESKKKCKDVNAMDVHDKRFRQAIESEKKFLQLANVGKMW